ncbi:unnamed protein product [Adineta steineri]|uniref:Uncharacterized protein n=2 Tax=Adineta steineri TaxID=433720 RepID=A0A815QBG2_9BILA|nr:unnamed protein product [Adineta steineri]CAF4271624.1 unnamed protein product [Adineta steineri]
MLNLYFKQLWLTTIFLTIFSFEEYRALTICPDMTWSSNGTTIAGSSLGLSNNTAAYLKKPQDAFVDQNGTLYVLDSGNLRVQVFFPNSTIGTTVINGTSGSKLNQFYTSNFTF